MVGNRWGSLKVLKKRGGSRNSFAKAKWSTVGRGEGAGSKAFSKKVFSNVKSKCKVLLLASFYNAACLLCYWDS